MENNRKLSASCVVIEDNKVLLVKHTYGAARGKYLIPGGFSEDEELPQITAERDMGIVGFEDVLGWHSNIVERE